MKLFLYFITLFLVAQSHGQTCKEGEVLCEGTKDECILKEYICDGLWLDCSNGWDESDCPCPPGEIKCPNSTMCIPASWICDTDWDCPGGEDEIDCTDCPGFLCADGLCLNARYRCDGELDCSNGEDERDCPPCTGFECSDGNCIPAHWKCDREWDCSDDEADCTCEPTDFRCDDGLCIPRSWECDDSADCRDKSDERNCSRVALPEENSLVPAVSSSRRVQMTHTIAQISKNKIKRDQKENRERKAQSICSRKMGIH